MFARSIHGQRGGPLATRSRPLTSAVAGVLTLLLSAFGVAQPGGGPAAVPGSRQATNVAVITIRGEISSVTARSVERRIKLAERAGANAIVIELDTPGGELYSALAISRAIKGAGITNTVAWVHPEAYSGGAIIALACRDIVTSDPGVMGDAIPIQLSPMGIKQLGEQERQKILAPLMADVVESARKHGRDELLVQGIVTTGVELWLVENLGSGQQTTVTRDEYVTLFGEEPPTGRARLTSAPSGVRRTPAPSGEPTEAEAPADQPPTPRALPKAGSDDPVRYIPASPTLETLTDEVTMNQTLAATRPVISASERGKWKLVEYVSTGTGPFVFSADDLAHFRLASATINTDEELKAYLGARNLLRLDQNWSEGLVAFMTNQIVRAVLIVVFLIALFLEMTNPGLVLPGTVAALALVSLIAPPMLINLANWWEVAAIVGGIGLLVLEIFVLPGFGVFGIVGLLALFGGLIGTFVPEGGMFPDTPQAQDDLLYGVVTLVLSVGTAGIGIYFLSKHFGSLPLFGQLVLKDGAPPDEQGDELLAAMAPEESGPVQTGMRGRTVTPLRPAGRVEIADRIVDAVAEIGYIPAGAEVVVTSVSPFRITVEKA